MATWNVGAFDNDPAVEWCVSLERASLDGRVALIRDTLASAVAVHEVTADQGAQVVAAAATILQVLTGEPDPCSPYAPHFLLSDPVLLISPQLIALSIEALDVVVDPGSPWRERWAGDIEEEQAIVVVEAMYAALAARRT